MVTVEDLSPPESKTQSRDKGGLGLTGGYDLEVLRWVLFTPVHVSLLSWSSAVFQGDLSCLQSHCLWLG